MAVVFVVGVEVEADFVVSDSAACEFDVAGEFVDFEVCFGRVAGVANDGCVFNPPCVEVDCGFT